MTFATKHYKNRHLEQLSRTSWPNDPYNVILKTLAPNSCFRAKSGMTTFTVFFFALFIAQRKCVFGENQLASPKRTIFEVVASQSYRGVLSGNTAFWGTKINITEGPFRKHLVYWHFGRSTSKKSDEQPERTSDVESRVATSRIYFLESAMLWRWPRGVPT